jgi:hypothetical protein
MRTRKPKVGNTVWVLLRLSTVADAERGFALKFYTEEDNWDMVGNKARKSRIVLCGTTLKNITATIGGKDERKN